MRMVLALVAAVLLSAGVQAQPVLDAGAIPGATAQLRASYAGFLLSNTPRAFATDGHGKSGWFSGGASLDDARQKAIGLCAGDGGVGCQPYALNLDVVWPGGEWRAPAPPPPFTDTWNWGLFPDERFLWHGPAAAAGVVLWAHGKASDHDFRGLQPPPFLRAFNNAGFDIVRFDRAPMADSTLRAAGWLQDGLRQMRAVGYRRVVAAGQSRGGWNALQAIDAGGLAEVVIAASPAAQGSGGSTNLTAQTDELRIIVDGAPASPARLAFIQFQQDPFDADPDTRARLISRLQGRLGGVLLIDRPAGLAGHFAAGGQQFSQRFAACLLEFATAPAAPSACRGTE